MRNKQNQKNWKLTLLLVSAIFLGVVAKAQTINSIAGASNIPGYTGDGSTGQATASKLYSPNGVCIDGSGNIYVAEKYYNRIRKIAPSGTTSTIAGYVSTAGAPSTSTGATDGTAISSSAYILNQPTDVAVDPSGNIYVADCNNHKIRKITPSGTISTFAGTGTAGTSSDGTLAASAKLYNPTGLAYWGGSLYIADKGSNRIKLVYLDGVDYKMKTIAGTGYTGTPTFSGDGNSAVLARLNGPTGVKVDNDGNIYIADNGNNAIRKVYATSAIHTANYIYTIAGNPSAGAGFSGDGASAPAAQMSSPYGIALKLNSDGVHYDVYIADNGNNRIRVVTPETSSIWGTITTIAGIAGTTSTTPLGDGGLAAAAAVGNPQRLDFDGNGDLIIPAANGIRKIDFDLHLTGSNTICYTGSTTLSVPSTVSGSSTPWASSNTSIAIVSSTGVVSGVAAGTVNITYMTSNYGTFAVFPMTIAGMPTVPAISSMAGSVCPSTTLDFTLSGAPSVPGTWSISAFTPTTTYTSSDQLATIDPATGHFVPTAGYSVPGTVTVAYSSTNVCGSTTVTRNVNMLVSTGTITGTTTVCEGSADVTLSDLAAGTSTGWSSSNTAVATIDATTGVVTPRAPGDATITYTVNNVCTAASGVNTITVTFTVNPLPSAGTIHGPASVCVGDDVVLWSDGDAGGFWEPNYYFHSTDLAYVDHETGVVTGNLPGVAPITYSIIDGFGCFASTNITILVNPLPNAGVIYGPDVICSMSSYPGSGINLASTVSGGTWSVASGHVADVTAGGEVLGPGYSAAGTELISYSVTNTCGTDRANYLITYEPIPYAGVIVHSGTSTSSSTPISLDVHSTTAGLTGTWAPSSTAVSLSGTTATHTDVTGIATGTASYVNVTYTVENSCAISTATYTIYVTGSRGAISQNQNGGGTMELKTYPNPTTGVVTLELPEQNDNTELMIFDVSGKVVETKTTNEAKISFDMSGYSKGVYMIQVKSGDHTYNEKVVFQ